MEELLEMSLGVNEALKVAAGFGSSSTAGTYQVVVAVIKNKRNEQHDQFRKVFLRDSKVRG